MASPLGTIYSRADALKRQLYDMLTNPSDAAAMLGGRIVESGQQAQALQEQTFADPNRPFRVTDPRAMARLTDMLMAGPMGFAPAGITAYHGSPYLFRQFDPTKKGTGEGAQAYGVGAGYTAEARPVAEGYKKTLSKDTFLSPNQSVITKNTLKDLGFDRSSIDVMFNALNQAGGDFFKAAELVARQRPSAAKFLRSLSGAKQNEGYLYKGDIPDEILPKFLDWDKPLSQQTDEIKSPFNLRVEKNPDPAPGEKWIVESNFGSVNAFNTKKEAESYLEAVTGGEVYQNIAVSRGTVNTSKLLEDSGLRGIRYLDQGSRGTSGQGTSNFIPFRPEDFKVEEINDIPLQDWINRGLL